MGVSAVTPQTGPQHWSEIGESTWVVGIRLLCAIDRLLGRHVFRLCALPVVCLHWLLNAPARRASLQYLRRLHAHAGGTGVFARVPGRWESLRHFRVFADTLLDKMLALGGRYPRGAVRVSRDNMLGLLREGRGAVIVTAHIGCLELCRALAEDVPGVRMTVLAHTHHAERFNRLIDSLPGSGGVRMLQVDTITPAVAAQLGECVARGEFVVSAGDRVPTRGGRCVVVDFLGQPAPFPIGVYVLAAALRCPLATMACVHEGKGYALRFETFAERVTLPRATREAALAGYAAQFARWLEAQLRTAPYDWFNFFAFWDQPVHAD
jgi:predicted LPLAT superfamily acyltransferase